MINTSGYLLQKIIIIQQQRYLNINIHHIKKKKKVLKLNIVYSKPESHITKYCTFITLISKPTKHLVTILNSPHSNPQIFKFFPYPFIPLKTLNFTSIQCILNDCKLIEGKMFEKDLKELVILQASSTNMLMQVLESWGCKGKSSEQPC